MRIFLTDQALYMIYENDLVFLKVIFIWVVAQQPWIVDKFVWVGYHQTLVIIRLLLEKDYDLVKENISNYFRTINLKFQSVFIEQFIMGFFTQEWVLVFSYEFEKQNFFALIKLSNQSYLLIITISHLLSFLCFRIHKSMISCQLWFIISIMQSESPELKKQAQNIRKFHPDKIPILLHRTKGSKLKDFENNKILILKSFTVFKLIMVIKKKLHLNHTEAIYLFADHTLLQADQTMMDVYEKYAGKDLFLHLNYCQYATFGNKNIDKN